MKHNKILGVVFLTILLDLLGLGILIPIFPALIEVNSAFRVIPDSWSYAEGFIMLGWLMATFPLLQFVCTPILGQLSDRFGRRTILIFSIIGTALSYLIFAFGIVSKSIVILFIARAIDGMSGANIAVAQAIIGDISPVKDRARNFGLIGVALGLGFIIGPFVGGILSDHTLISWFNPTIPFLFAACMSGVNMLVVLKFLPETVPVKIMKRIDITRPFNNVIKAFSIPHISSIMTSIFLFNSGFAFFTTFWGVVLALKFGFSQSGIGNYFAYTGIMIVLAQGLFVRRLSGKVAEHKVLYYSIILTGLAILVNYLIPSVHVSWLYFTPPFLAIGASLTRSFSVALLTNISPAEIRGEIMGINASTFALSQIFPSVLAGYLAAAHASLPILVGSVCAILGGLIFIYTWIKSHRVC